MATERGFKVQRSQSSRNLFFIIASVGAERATLPLLQRSDKQCSSVRKKRQCYRILAHGLRSRFSDEYKAKAVFLLLLIWSKVSDDLALPISSNVVQLPVTVSANSKPEVKWILTALKSNRARFAVRWLGEGSGSAATSGKRKRFRGQRIG